MHGLWRVAATEGVTRLWAGASMTCSRAALMTIGQLAFYDQIKIILLSTSFFNDNVVTHVTSSLLAVRIQFIYVLCYKHFAMYIFVNKPHFLQHLPVILIAEFQNVLLLFYLLCYDTYL